MNTTEPVREKAAQASGWAVLFAIAVKYRDLAHALKGSARYLGLTQIADLAKDMQNMPEQEFKHKGIGNIIGLGKAADAAFEILQDRLSRFPTEKAAG